MYVPADKCILVPPVRSAKKKKLHVFARKRNLKNIMACIEAVYVHTVILTDIVLFLKRLHFWFKTRSYDSAEWLSKVRINIREVAALNTFFSSNLTCFYSP